MSMLYSPFEVIDDYSLIQTFYADSEIVNGSSEISITSIDLYFKFKPDNQYNATGKPAPGVSVQICEVENDEPNLSTCYYNSRVRKAYDQIYAYSDASSPTIFNFSTPIKLRTNKFYGIVITLEDPAYVLWTNKQGDKLYGTNTPSPGSNIVKDGKLFQKNTSNIFKALSDTDLKFAIKVAKFVSNTTNEVFVNKDYEFFTVQNRQGNFLGGEIVYQVTANATGNVTFISNTTIVVGDGTNFSALTPGTLILLHANTTSRQIFAVQSVTNATYLNVTSLIPFTNTTATKYMIPPCGKVYYKDNLTNKMFLSDSNANTTLKFGAGNTIIGIDSTANAVITSVDAFSVDRVKLKGDTKVPPSGKIETTLTTAIYDGAVYTFNTSNALKLQINDKYVDNISKWDAFVLSRSLEVDNSSLYTNTDLFITRKSFKLDASLQVQASNTGLFNTPTVERGKLDLFTLQNSVSNTYLQTDANSRSVDSEIFGNGVASSRHISTKVKFANNRFAEDVRLFMTAYRPATTDLKVYCRVHNSNDPDAFDDKAWTPLEYKANGLKKSSLDDENDFVEYELGFPQYTESANVLPGVFTTQLSNAVLVATDNPSSYIANNNLVKIYNPLIPQDYIVGVVVNSNTTSITLGSAISNNNLVGSGFKVDRLLYYNTAFNNYTNDNVARYYNSSMVEFDKFDSMQIKIVMLADNTYKVPRVDQIQVIGVSA